MARLIGWREWVGLPDLGIDRIKVKVDTGAKTSALHAFKVTTQVEDGQEWVEFLVHPLQKNTQVEVRCRAPVKEHRTVRDSGGHEESRIVIDTVVELGDERWPIEVTLTDRESMGFRMLLGRSALRHKFYVDASHAYVLTRAVAGDDPTADYEEE